MIRSNNSKYIFRAIYVIIFALVLTNKYGPYRNLNYNNMTIVATALVSFPLFVFFRKRVVHGNNIILIKDGEYYFKIFFVMQVFMEIYAIFLVAIGVTKRDWISTNLISISAPIFFITTLYIFKEKSINIVISIVITSFYLNLIFNLFYYGPSSILDVIRSIVFGTDTQMARAYELGDISFAAGVLLIYALLSQRKITKFRLFSLVLAVVFGQKRIEFFAIIAVFLLVLFLAILRRSRITKKFSYYSLNVLMFASIFLCIGYVIISLDGRLQMLFESYGVNSMNRTSFYHSISKYASFSPTYIGLGRNSVVHILSGNFNYAAHNLHNDLLKMYVEEGFAFYVLWLIIYLLYIPKKVRKIISYETAVKVILLFIYMFLLYTTDNAESYFIVQVSMLFGLTFISYNDRVQEGIRLQKSD